MLCRTVWIYISMIVLTKRRNLLTTFLSVNLPVYVTTEMHRSQVPRNVLCTGRGSNCEASLLVCRVAGLDLVKPHVRPIRQPSPARGRKLVRSTSSGDIPMFEEGVRALPQRRVHDPQKSGRLELSVPASLSRVVTLLRQDNPRPFFSIGSPSADLVHGWPVSQR